jgi:hypothetical protein
MKDRTYNINGQDVILRCKPEKVEVIRYANFIILPDGQEIDLHSRDSNESLAEIYGMATLTSLARDADVTIERVKVENAFDN